MRTALSSLCCLLPVVVLGTGVDVPTAWKSDWAGLLQPMVATMPTPSRSVKDTSDQAVESITTARDAVIQPEPDPVPPVYISADQIIASLRDAVVEQFNLEGELVLVPNASLKDIRVPDESWFVELVPPYPSNLTSRLHLRYRLTDGFISNSDQTISLQAELWRDAYVSNRILRPGDLDAKNAYSVANIDWLKYRGELIPTTNDLSDIRLKMAWRAGEPLRWSTVESRPVIEEGEIVEVVATDGPLRITMRGVATESGRAGELITVRNLQSRKEIQGIVTHESTVLVVF